MSDAANLYRSKLKVLRRWGYRYFVPRTFLLVENIWDDFYVRVTLTRREIFEANIRELALITYMRKERAIKGGLTP